MKLHFVVNERSGNFNGLKKWNKIKSELTIPHKAHITQYEKHAIEIVQKLSKYYQESDEKVYIFIIGGDGSLHEALNGLTQHDRIIIGAISAGSGNDFKRWYGDFETAQQIESYVSKGHSAWQDLGCIQAGKHKIDFANNCGIGFDATVAITANESKIKKALNKVGLGKLCYVFYLVKCLFTFKPFNLKVEMNGKLMEYKNVWFATCSNQPFFGGGMKISPTSKTDDGLLELTVVHNLSKLKLLFVFGTVFFGKHTIFKEIEQMTANQFKLQLEQPYLFHADGEKLPIDTSLQPIYCTVNEQSWQLAVRNN